MKNTIKLDNKELSSRRKSKFSSFFHLPLIWMLVGVFGIVLTNVTFNWLGEDSKALGTIVITVVGCIIAIGIYWLVMKFLARRPVPELRLKGAVSEAIFGGVIGLAFVLVSTLIVVLFGGYSFNWSADNVGAVILPIITTSFAAALIEELVFRGLAFQAIEKIGGSWIALVLTSLFFGIAHLGNPGATIWGGFSIAIEAGVLLGLAFLWRRNIWFIFGLHFFWNTTVGLLGIPVSGHPSTGLFTVEVTGPTLLTGGDFGVEASIVTIIISLLITIPMLVFAQRKGNFVALRQNTK